MENTLEQVSWNLTRGEGYVMHNTGSPFSEHGSYICVTNFDKPVKLFEIGDIPGRTDEEMFGGIEIKSSYQFMIANPERGLVIADTQLSMGWQGDDLNPFANFSNGYFRKGKLIAISGVSSLEFREDMRDVQSEFKLPKIFANEVDKYARLSKSKDVNAFETFQNYLLANSPYGEGLHESYRNSISGILKKLTN